MQKSRRIRLFESSIEKTGRILSQKWNIRVVFKANECRTTGRVIYLPTLPNNASDDLLTAMQGHLDHETAHVLFTDFRALKKVKRSEKKLYSVINALEDPRIEQKMGDLWRGTVLNFRRSLEWSLRKICAEKEEEDEHGNKVMKRSWDMLSDFGKFAYGATVWMQVKFDDSHWFITDVVDAPIMSKIRSCEALLRAACVADDTAEVVGLSRQVMAKIQEEEEKVEFADPADVGEDDIVLPPQGMGADHSAMRKKDDNSKPADPNAPKVFQSEYADEDICDECGGTGEDDNGAPCESCEGTGLSEEAREDAPQGGTPSGSVGGEVGDEDEDGDEAGQPSAAPDLSDVSDEEMDRDSQILDRSEMLREASQQDFDGSDKYLIYTTEGDKIEYITEGDRVKYRQFLSETSSMVSTIKRKLARSMLSSNTTRWEGDKTRGKINPRAVFRVPLGTSKRVFRQKVESEDFNTVVELMVDHSGSMNGSRLSLAGRTVAVLGEVLHQLSIPFSVTGFSTGEWNEASSRKNKAPAEARSVYTRWGNLWIGVYKDYNDPWPRAAHKVTTMVNNSRVNTYDGESVRWGTQRLLLRPEKRKILLWLNDGSPCPNGGDSTSAHVQYAADCAKEAESLVELLAIGIQTDAVKRFYKNYVVVNKLDELPSVCLNELDALLRKGKNLRAA